MAFAVVGSTSIVRCAVGAENEKISPAIAIGITLSGNTASTIFDCKPTPNFGECATWAALTAGSSTSCNPAVVPVWMSGVASIFWDLVLANGSDDMAMCAIGGAITIPYAGTTILIT